MIGDRKVNLFFDEVMFGHDPQMDLPFVPSPVEKRVKSLLQALDSKWSYPEHPGRLMAIKKYLDENQVPCIHFMSCPSATYEQLSRVHTTSYLDDIFSMAGKNAWLVLAGGEVPELQECGVKEVTEAAEFHHSAFTNDY